MAWLRTAVLVNPHARALQQKPKLITAVTLAAGGSARVWVTRDAVAVTRAAEEIASTGVERVVLCGGDGTLMSAVTALHRAVGTSSAGMPELVIAPAGTVATVARNFGQRAGLLDTVRRAVAFDPPRRRLRTPTLELQVEEGTLLGFIFGTGLVARFFEKYYAQGAGGYRCAALITLRTFVGSFVEDAYSSSVLDPLPCEVTIDGATLEPRAFSLVVASVVKDLGLHMWVTPRAAEDPARPHVVCKSLTVKRLGPQAHRVLRGLPIEGPGFDGLCERLAVTFPDAAGPLVLDGDVLFSRTAIVRAGPIVRVAAY